MSRLSGAVVAALLLVGALCLLPVASAAQSAAQEGLELDASEWDRLASRAEAVVDAAAASDSALLVLRSQLEEWRAAAVGEQERIGRRIDQLGAQIEALGPADADASDETGTAALRRADLESRLAQANAPYRIAAEVIRRAEGLVAEIDGILDERERQRLVRLGPSPLNPGSWSGLPEYLSAQFGAIAGELADSWSRDAQRRLAQEKLPLILLYLVVGAVLLTRVRNLVVRVEKRISRNLDGRDAEGLALLLSLVSDLAFPVLGLWALVLAAEASGLAFVNSGRVLQALPLAGFLAFGGRWISEFAFSDSETGLLRSRLGSEWTSSGRFAARAIGIVWGVQVLAVALPDPRMAQPDLDALVAFPFVLAVSYFAFRISRLLLAHAAAAPPEGQEAGWDRTVTLIAWVVTAVAAAAPALAAFGYGEGAGRLIYPSMFSLALLAAYFALNRVLLGCYSSVLKAVGAGRAARGAGLVKLVLGILLAAAMAPMVAIAWGASDADLAEYWALFSEGVLIGGQRITATDLLTFVAVFLAGAVATNMAQTVLRNSILPGTHLDPGAQKAVVTGAGYVGIVLAAVLAVSFAGLDLTNLAIVAGALSVGIGFGLQAIVSNFVSGIILLIERPINEGDWIEAGGVSGTVRRISVRSTLIETFDRATVVVPNNDIMSGQVTNWTLGNRYCRIRIPVGVAYGTDAREVERILVEIARSHDAVLDDPAPAAIFMGFGDNALEFELRVYLRDVNYFLSAKSQINFAVAERFAEAGISIPFPQRDVWIRGRADEAEELPPAVERDKT